MRLITKAFLFSVPTVVLCFFFVWLGWLPIGGAGRGGPDRDVENTDARENSERTHAILADARSVTRL